MASGQPGLSAGANLGSASAAGTGTGPETTTTTTTTGEKSFFEQQREILLQEIGVSFEHVLANINKLNRSLEGVIAVGNEFSSVEALWSQFENVMAKDPERDGQGSEKGGDGNGEGEEELDAEHGSRR